MRILLLTMSLFAAALAPATQVQDHLKCYRMTDPLQLEGVVDLDAEQFGLDRDCRVSRAKLFCVPTKKAVVIARNRKTGERIDPLPVTGPDAGDRICYTVRCPARAVPNPEVSDQFGTRTIGPRRAQFLCTPAVKGPPPTTTTTASTTTLPPMTVTTTSVGTTLPPTTIDCSSIETTTTTAPFLCGSVTTTTNALGVGGPPLLCWGGGCGFGQTCADVGGQCACVGEIQCHGHVGRPGQCNGGTCPPGLSCTSIPCGPGSSGVEHCQCSCGCR